MHFSGRRSSSAGYRPAAACSGRAPGRFKGSSREHIESDLQCYLAWCGRPHIEQASLIRPGDDFAADLAAAAGACGVLLAVISQRGLTLQLLTGGGAWTTRSDHRRQSSGNRPLLQPSKR
jgi:hypothetical protein